ncbi:cytochrome c3 family protein [Seleniivibrio sp.]|uniref:cytochrome c3 family protein n=1 Tax=Seleniivibrio sp. TaxID=2898801 RepID=UPI0025D4DA1E|nr:cytochrome c3 family protein [Seleniivibrio sp.]MCD8554775.1 cytochrome c3 family protein [Seleniivibrio sp.]
MRSSNLFIFVFIFAAALALVFTANANELKGKHKEAAVACADCHKTDTPDKPAPVTSCKECHGGYAEVKELTKGGEVNPHDSHLGEVDCRDCHKIHAQSQLVCASCHNFELIVP